MGWNSGSVLMHAIIEVVKREVVDEGQRARIYPPIIEGFRREDWDTEDECRGVDPVFDEALDT